MLSRNGSGFRNRLSHGAVKSVKRTLQPKKKAGIAGTPAQFFLRHRAP